MQNTPFNFIGNVPYTSLIKAGYRTVTVSKPIELGITARTIPVDNLEYGMYLYKQNMLFRVAPAYIKNERLNKTAETYISSIMKAILEFNMDKSEYNKGYVESRIDYLRLWVSELRVCWHKGYIHRMYIRKDGVCEVEVIL